MSDRPQWMIDAERELDDKDIYLSPIAEECFARHYSAEAERVKELREAAYLAQTELAMCDCVSPLKHRVKERLRKALEGWEK